VASGGWRDHGACNPAKSRRIDKARIGAGPAGGAYGSGEVPRDRDLSQTAAVA